MRGQLERDSKQNTLICKFSDSVTKCNVSIEAEKFIHLFTKVSFKSQKKFQPGKTGGPSL